MPAPDTQAVPRQAGVRRPVLPVALPRRLERPERTKLPLDEPALPAEPV
jgi:hypothetical protein